MKTNKYRIISIIAVAISIFSVSAFVILYLLFQNSPKPSHKDIERLVKDNLLKSISYIWGEDVADIENITKVNGIEKSNIEYIADLKYDIVYKKDADSILKKIKRRHGEFGGFSTSMLELSLMSAGANSKFKAGDRDHIEHSFTFIKTEKGWEITEDK